MKLGLQIVFVAGMQLSLASCATANTEKSVSTSKAAEQVEVVENGSVSDASSNAPAPIQVASNAENAAETFTEKETPKPTATLSDADSFTKLLEAVSTMQGAFTQTLYDESGSELQNTTGTFKVLRPGYFYWEVNPPYQQIVVGSPNSLKIYDPDLEQMTIQESASLSGTPAAFMSGESSAIFSEYSVVKTEKEKIIDYTFSLKPSSNASFAQLKFVFDRTNKAAPILSFLAFKDKLGQETQVQLKDVIANKALSEQAFQFVPPEGTDIIVDG